MKKIVFLIFFVPLCLNLFIVRPSQGEIYKYTDKDGVTSYVDSIQAVPEKYRKKAVEVRGLREKGEAAKTSESAATAKASSQDEIMKEKVKKAAEGFKETGYWRHIGVAAAFLILVMLIGKLTRTMGSGPMWTLIKLALALCFTIGVFYVYSKEVSDILDSLFDRTNVVTKKVEIMKSNVEKNPGDK